MVESLTVKNSIISSNILIWKLCGNAQFPQIFTRIVETQWKLCVSKKILGHESRWNFGILHSDSHV